MKLVIAPNQKLRVNTKPVKNITPALLEKIKNMVKLTKTFVDPEGVGLASTQVGENEQFFVAKQEDKSFKAYFNPKILNYSKKTKTFFEGCLSIPKYWGEIQRPVSVLVQYMDEGGQTVKKRLTGFEAHVFQHEVDHLNGRLFMDIVMEQKARLFKVVGKDQAGSDLIEEVKL